MLSPCRGRRGGDAEIDVAAAHRELHAAVLRQAAFGKVELRQYLDAGDDAGDHGAGEHLRRLQGAVDAVADAKSALRRLKMHVGSARRDGLAYEPADEADDRRLAGDVLQPLDILFARLGRCRAVASEPRRLAVEPLEGRVDFAFRRDADAERDVQVEGERADGVGLKRARGRHNQCFSTALERQHAGALQKLRAHPLKFDRLLGEIVAARERKIEKGGLRLHQPCLADQPELAQDGIDRLPRSQHRRTGALGGTRFKEAPLHHEIDQCSGRTAVIAAGPRLRHATSLSGRRRIGEPKPAPPRVACGGRLSLQWADDSCECPRRGLYLAADPGRSDRFL